MTKLSFPEDAAAMAAAFNNGLAKGVFCDDPGRETFWAHYELLATVAEEGEPVIDVFRQVHISKYLRISREPEETEK